MLRTLGRGILRAVANEANTRRLDERNQLIDFRLRLRITRQPDRSDGEQQRENGSEKLTHEIGLAGCLEQPLDGQPAYHLCLDALPEIGLPRRDVAHLLATLARHPHETVSREFDAIRVAAEIALGLP